ncbi:MAG TPA: hypothetical protein VGP48_13670 [Stellaceae bacterium]|jgi:hypothetical protein|nr:hypothetical protein [Stellaceae bacterium]
MRYGSAVMRKALLLIVAVGLIAGGTYLLAQSLAHPNVYSVLRGAGVAVIFVALGAYLLWDDFVKDRFRRPKT